MAFIRHPFGSRLEGSQSAQRLRDQAAQDMGLKLPERKTFIEALFAKQDDLSDADRQALLNFGAALSGSNKPFFGGALGEAGAAYGGTQEAFFEKMKADNIAAKQRQIEEEQRQLDNAFRNKKLAAELAIRKMRAANAGSGGGVKVLQSTRDEDGHLVHNLLDGNTIRRVDSGQIAASDPRNRAQANTIGDLHETIQDQQKSLASLQTGFELLQSAGGMPQGPMANLEIGMRKAMVRSAKAFGMEVDEDEVEMLAASDAFRSLMIDQMLARVQQTKGSISESENRMFTRAAPNFGNLDKGNDLLYEISIYTTKKALERNRFILRQMENNAKTYSEAEAAWEEKVADDNGLAKILKRYGLNPRTGEPFTDGPEEVTMETSDGKKVKFKKLSE